MHKAYPSSDRQNATRSEFRAFIVGALIVAAMGGLSACVDDSEADTPDRAVGTKEIRGPALVRSPVLQRENRVNARWIVRGPISSGRVVMAYHDQGLGLDDVLSGNSAVPRLAFFDLPYDLPRIKDTERRKRVFLATVLPAVVAVNDALTRDRDRLKRLAGAKSLKSNETVWLEAMAKRYATEPTPDALLDRVDIVAVPLALAQAALESGWGRSSFAQIGNALFGEHTDDATSGMKPGGTPDNSSVYVERFDHLVDAVASYAYVLNSGKAFESFRQERREMRRAGKNLDAHRLARTLEAYSERGASYVNDVQTVIAANGLAALASAGFLAGKTIVVSEMEVEAGAI